VILPPGMKIRRGAGRSILSISALAAIVAGIVTGLLALPRGSSGAVEPEMIKMPIRGVVRAVYQATFSTELQALVSKVGFKVGERFEKGDTLLAFDCRRYKAQLAAAEAQHREMMVALQTNEFLQTKGAGSKQDLDTAKAREDKASAEADGLRAVIDQCEILAPFKGRVSDLQIREHEMPSGGRPLLSIMSTEELEIELILPSSWLRWLKPNAAFGFLIDETGRTYHGRIIRTGAAVDTISQTIKVTGQFLDFDPSVLPGMSGEAVFAGQEG